MNDNFIQFKNYLHNDLGISKSEVREIYLDVLKRSFECEINNILKSNNLDLENYLKSQIDVHLKSILVDRMDNVIKRDDFPHILKGGNVFSYLDKKDFSDWLADTMKETILTELYNSFNIKFSIDMKGDLDETK